MPGKKNNDISNEAINLATTYWESKKNDSSSLLLDLIEDAADDTMERYEAKMRKAVNEFHQANDILTILNNVKNDRKK
ncbi:MAG: hypothetical protein GOVbin1709_34 [Prokaryotic dsDNA virus sp.]|nr:MAG: hypothetical protein GOVbin1709_34 [Prokaryotic dsDNA virus sp.]|tara:strand:+ start:1713 stop:1946 length:234 start_codon:yes stop_codon:yes gene_type:complete